jgi:hypothetical protein
MNALIAEAAAGIEAERTAKDAQLASVIESMTMDSACRASYCDGRSDERHRTMVLLEEYISTLKRTGRSTATLEALRFAVEGG